MTKKVTVSFSVFIQEQIKMGNYSKCCWQNPQERSISQDRRQERKPPWAREHEENTHSYSFFFFSLFFSLLFFSKNSPSHTMHHHRAGKRESPYQRQEVGKECFTKRGAVFQMYFSPSIFPYHIVSKADTLMQNSTGCENSERTVSLVRETGKGALVRQIVWCVGRALKKLEKKMNLRMNHLQAEHVQKTPRETWQRFGGLKNHGNQSLSPGPNLSGTGERQIKSHSQSCEN